MNATQPGGDVRGFYAALEVPLPDWAHTEAPVRCFTNPGAHAHHDQHPSCSVNVHSGAFNCTGAAPTAAPTTPHSRSAARRERRST